MSWLRRRPVILALTVIAGFAALARLGVLPTILVLTLGVTAAVVLPRRSSRTPKRPATSAVWRPTVQHQELPAPVDDPLIGWAEPQVEMFASHAAPLAQLGLSATARGQLDGFALGRAKRIIDAPDLLAHAAADVESWPNVEAAVNKTLGLLHSRQVVLLPEGSTRLSQALAWCAAQGVLLAEWRQLEDGRTVWNDSVARVRASDAFTIQRIAEVMQRRVLPDLFAGIAKRPADLEISVLVPYAIATAFYLRLHGDPPKAFAA